jgi:hypothetical protein
MNFKSPLVQNVVPNVPRDSAMVKHWQDKPKLKNLQIETTAHLVDRHNWPTASSYLELYSCAKKFLDNAQQHHLWQTKKYK